MLSEPYANVPGRKYEALPTRWSTEQVRSRDSQFSIFRSSWQGTTNMHHLRKVKRP